MLLRRRNKAETLPCCLCGAHISKEAGVFYSLTFPGRTHKGGRAHERGRDRFWLHLECIEGAMHTSDANLDRDEAYGWKYEDLEEVLQRESWPAASAGLGSTSAAIASACGRGPPKGAASTSGRIEGA